MSQRPVQPPSRLEVGRLRPQTGAGFTIFELLLTMLIIVIVLTGVLTLFDANTELARAQTHLANMQQSLRVAQYDMVRNVRMTGRGPLLQRPIGVAAADKLDALAVGLRNNVPDDEHIAIGDDTSPDVVPGTDILTIRGVFNSSLFQFNPTAGAFAVTPAASPTEGTLVIGDLTPTGIPQNLEIFREIIDRVPFAPEALLIVSPLDDAVYAVVELRAGSTYAEASGVVTQVNLEFNITGGDYTSYFNTLSSGPNGSYPIELQTASFAGVLEEYRYYIRSEREIDGDDSSRLNPRLTRARFYPGSELAYLEDDVHFRSDVADNVLDLQVALGIDADGDAMILENDPPDASDDWLFNSSADDSTDTRWVTNLNGISQLYYVRLNTLVRTDRQDRGFEAELLTDTEDKVFTSSPGDEYNTADQRAFRRRWMQTIVDMRNIS